MNVFTRIGVWVDKHFPERMTTEEVNKKFLQLIPAMRDEYSRIELMTHDHNVRLKKLEDEIRALKNQSQIRSRIVPDTMTPFASRPTPMPTVGGTK